MSLAQRIKVHACFTFRATSPLSNFRSFYVEGESIRVRMGGRLRWVSAVRLANSPPAHFLLLL